MKRTKKAALLSLLRRKYVTPLIALRVVGILSLAQRVSEWRSAGVCVVDKWVKTEGGARVKAYRVVSPTKWTA